MNDELLIKFLLKEANPEEDTRVKAWLSASSENRKEYERFELIWESSKKLASTNQSDPDLAWTKFKGRMSSIQADGSPLRRINGRSRWLNIAAVFVIAVTGWLTYSLYDQKYNFDTLKAGNTVRNEVLPDGSHITLNKNTVLTYKKGLKGENRLVKLDRGEVFFDVSPDKSRPFIIEADDITVKVLGTAFNVKHIKGQTEVIVETGLVKVSLAAQEIELRPGEKVSVTPEGGALKKEKNTDRLYNYYRSKLFIADRTPLRRVVEILNEAYGADIVIGKPGLGDQKLTTTFQDDSLSNIIQIICETFKVNAVEEQGRITLK